MALCPDIICEDGPGQPREWNLFLESGLIQKDEKIMYS